ncbi:MAG: TRAM domain-containing protein, partial [Bacteroidota bacterium]
MPPQEIYRDLELQLEVGNPVFSTTGGSSLSGEGMCVARHENFVYFVVGAVPGDLVTAKVFKVKKNYAEARAVKIDRPSPLRTEPRCKHFGVCGGCKWQHADYDAQLRFKQQRVIDA